MKRFYILALLLAGIFSSCSNKDAHQPDISNITIPLETHRFDKDFFAVDTLQLEAGLHELAGVYPDFLSPYLGTVIGTNDLDRIQQFLTLYRPVYDTAQIIFNNFEAIEQEIKTALAYTRYYFPSYSLPHKIYPFIGALESRNNLALMENGDYVPVFLGQDFIGISLQFYLGGNFSGYNNEFFVNAVAPTYISRRFDKKFITADVMKIITDDLYPERNQNLSLIEIMIEKGKRWWLQQLLQPETAQQFITGYTEEQLKWCNDYEGLIWTTFIKNEDLYSQMPATLQQVVGEGPFTQGFSQEASPGRLGVWIGWQIVKKFRQKNPELTVDEIMKTPAIKLFDQAGYKPK